MLELWEFHPMLVHFPIAFLLGAVGVFLFNTRKKNLQLNQVANGMLVAGVLFGWLAAIAGGLAWFTVPAHTEWGHVLMYWHIGFALSILVLFTSMAFYLFRTRTELPGKNTTILLVLATILLVVTGHLGASLVFREGAGVDPKILAPEIRDGHTHQSGHSHGSPETNPDHSQADSHDH